VVKAMV